MSNPYLPDLEKVRNSYEMSKSEDVVAVRAQISLSHPYKTIDDVKKALYRSEDINSICKKMTTELKNDKELMLNLIEKDAAAYVYANKDIKTDEFKQLSIMANSQVYNLLSDVDRKSLEINDAYLYAKMSDLTKRPLDVYSDSMQFKIRFSDKTNKDLVFSEEKYREHYIKMVDNGPYINHRLLGEDYAYIAAARLLNPEKILQYNQIERDYWLKHEKEVLSLALKDRSKTDNDHILSAIEERCPEYVQKIREIQERREELINQLSNGRFDPNTEMDDIQRQLVQNRLVELQRDKERVEKEQEFVGKQKNIQRIEKEQQELLAYYKASAVSQAYDMASIGNMSFSSAIDVASYVGNVPNQAAISGSMEQIASIEAKENDNHNVSEQETEYLECLDREEYYDDIEEENEEKREEQELILYDFESGFDGLSELFERSEGYEWSPLDWKHSPPDEERFHEYSH